jgi:hypothetical protein
LTPGLFLFAGEVSPGISLSFCAVAVLTAGLPIAVFTRFFAGLDKPGREDVAAGVAVDPSCFGGAKSSLEDREVGFNELNGVEGFLGVPKLVVRGSGCAVWGCGGGNVGCGSADVGVGFGMASLEERAGVAMRDFLLLGTALGRGVASSDV